MRREKQAVPDLIRHRLFITLLRFQSVGCHSPMPIFPHQGNTQIQIRITFRRCEKFYRRPQNAPFGHILGDIIKPLGGMDHRVSIGVSLNLPGKGSGQILSNGLHVSAEIGVGEFLHHGIGRKGQALVTGGGGGFALQVGKQGQRPRLHPFRAFPIYDSRSGSRRPAPPG